MAPRIVAIHQPQYLPWGAYIDKADGCDCFVLLDDVQFSRRGVQHRNRINNRGVPLMLTVPVVADRTTPINEVRINGAHWARKHIASIRHAYAAAPFRDWFEDGLMPILLSPWDRLVDLNRAVTNWLFKVFGIGCECVLASELAVAGEREERILALCAAAGGGIYLSGQGARAYQCGARFRERGIELRYQSYAPRPYPQCHGGDFVPDLSALDLVLNTGPRAREYLRAGREIAQ